MTDLKKPLEDLILTDLKKPLEDLILTDLKKPLEDLILTDLKKPMEEFNTTHNVDNLILQNGKFNEINFENVRGVVNHLKLMI